MSFTIKLQNNQSPKNQFRKTLVDIITLTGTLRNDTSIINPIIRIEGSISTLKTCNYATIQEFGRSYFVTNIQSFRNGIIELSLHCDVLTTFKDSILSNRAITRRQKASWNLYLNDGALRSLQPQKIQLLEFPNGFDSFHYILAVAGS